MSLYINTVINPLYDASYPTLTTVYNGPVANSTAYPPGPNSVWVMVTTAAYVTVGVGAIATAANGLPVVANVPVTISVPPGTSASWRVSVLQIATAGNLYTKPLGN